MPRTRRYDLAYNWAANRPTPFTDAVTESARRHRLSVLPVGRGEADTVRRRLERGRIGIGVFLNTQADGTNLDSPSMTHPSMRTAPSSSSTCSERGCACRIMWCWIGGSRAGRRSRRRRVRPWAERGRPFPATG